MTDFKRFLGDLWATAPFYPIKKFTPERPSSLKFPLLGKQWEIFRLQMSRVAFKVEIEGLI